MGWVSRQLRRAVSSRQMLPILGPSRCRLRRYSRCCSMWVGMVWLLMINNCSQQIYCIILPSQTRHERADSFQYWSTSMPRPFMQLMRRIKRTFLYQSYRTTRTNLWLSSLLYSCFSRFSKARTNQQRAYSLSECPFFCKSNYWTPQKPCSTDLLLPFDSSPSSGFLQPLPLTSSTSSAIFLIQSPSCFFCFFSSCSLALTSPVTKLSQILTDFAYFLTTCTVSALYVPNYVFRCLRERVLPNPLPGRYSAYGSIQESV